MVKEFKFCPICRTPLGPIVNGGLTRLACINCGFMHYRNPVPGVAVVIVKEGCVLLGHRAPGQIQENHWCIPCGHIEWGEDVREAARREFLEETSLHIRVGTVYAVHSNFHDPESLTIGIWFLGEVIGGKPLAGDDLDDLRYFPVDSPPEPLAFPTDRLVLDQLREDILGQ